MEKRRVVVLGGGYGGLAAVRRLSRLLEPDRYSVLLVDASPHHTVKTRFHELAVSADRNLFIRFSLPALARASRAEFLRARVERLEPRRRAVLTDVGEVPYDRLLVALGGETAHFGVPGAAEHTVALQTYEGAMECNRRVRFLGIGGADGPLRRVVVCGAGIEGLEVAAMLRQAARPEQCEVTVVERSGTLMERSQCGESERRYLARYLERRRIGLRLGASVAAVEPGRVLLEGGEALEADLVYWCSGVRRVGLDGLVPGSAFLVDEHLRWPEHPDVFGLGDFATVDSSRPFSNLGSAQRALYQGELAAENLGRLELGLPLKAADYRPKGEVIGLGDTDGVGVVGGIPLLGLAAALLKKAIEARYLTELHGDLPRHLLRTALQEEA